MEAYIGLGSNLGDRRAQLRAALAELERRGLELVALSSAWATEPAEGAGGAWFLNMVARVETALGPEALLALLLDVERGAGRVRPARHAPRTLDLDLLLAGDAVCASERLTLPHPRMWERRFVLAPLAEIAPGLRDPASGRTVAELLRRAAGRGGVRRLGRLARARAHPL